MPFHKHPPQLPAKFIQELLEKPTFSDIRSFVFNPDYQAQRFKMVTGSNPTQADLSSDSVVCLPDGKCGMESKNKRTALHLGSITGDALLVCEMIRIGATIDHADAHGATALWLAAASLAKCTSATRQRVRTRKAGDYIPPDPTLRVAFVIRTLVEQHANVNIVYEGTTPLYHACVGQHWETVSLLLEHGAIPSLVAHSFNITDRKRFNALVERFAGKPRPARPCPCWSGELLSLCHDAEEKPYPPEFICRCGSGKTYAKCCTRRNAMSIVDKWDEENDWIMSVTKKVLPLPAGVDPMRDTSRLLANAQAAGLPLPAKSDLLKYQHKIADVLESEGYVDIAYAYALRQVDFNPRPAGKSASKRRCLEFQKEWNEAIDKYIAIGADPRSREEIEWATKIGSSCGALYRYCEGPGCEVMEGADVIKLQYCAKCKIAVYCSRACQTKAWPTHKGECNTPLQTEQALPSQEAMIQLMSFSASRM